MNDTCWGINNEGGMAFDYYHTDEDRIGNANVYNGQNSTLWVNFREAFPDKIQETYQELRKEKLTYEKLINQFITLGSDKWSESIYNEDGDFKYMSMLRESGDATNLPQIRGTGEEHLRYFIENRLNFCDSKWYAGSYPDDIAVVRIYTPVDENNVPLTDLVVPANADITITPFSHMYAGVRYKANGTLYQERVEANQVITFEAPDEVFNDTETAVYGASQISSFGDLSPLYLGYVDVSKATKLIELIIGNSTPGYHNGNLYHLAVGTNRLLKKIDIQNCGGKYKQALNLTGCPNIEEIYAKGSDITGVDLPDSGYLKIMQLPNTVANITIKNQPYLNDFSLEGYNNVKTIHIENCPTIDTLDLLDKCENVERVRLTDVNWNHPDAELLYELIDRNIKGIDENNTNTDFMWVDGKCHIDYLTGEQYAYIKSKYPYLDITYGTLESQLIFMTYNGETELTRQTVLNAGNGECPVTNGTIEAPVKEPTAQYTFTFNGWSKAPNGEADNSALLNVEADRVVYAAYSQSIRNYTVNFYVDGVVKETYTIPYGGTATYAGGTPTSQYDYLEFVGWKPEPTNITGDTNCYAQWYDNREITDSWETIAAACLDGTAVDKYAIGSYKNLYIGATELPYDFYNGAAVVWNDEIHMLGGNNSRTSHYKWNGAEWIEVSTIPYGFYYGSSVIYDNEIHILGTDASNYKTSHYKWNGTEWISVSTLPYEFRQGVALVYNNEIHLVGGYTHATSHYKWDGTEWISVSTLPFSAFQHCAFVLNNEIHILGGPGSYKKHYKWNGSEWIQLSNEPFGPHYSSFAVIDNKAHIVGNRSGNSSKSHYVYDGTEWIKMRDIPYSLEQGSAVALDNQIYLLGGVNSGTLFYSCDISTDTWTAVNATETIPMEVAAHNHDELPDGVNKWESVTTIPNITNSTRSVIYNNEIHTLRPGVHKKYDGSSWTDVSVCPATDEGFDVAVWNNEIHIMGSGKSGGTKYHASWNGSEWVEYEASLSPQVARLVTFNNELYMAGAYNYPKVYKWNGTEWNEVGTIPRAGYATAFTLDDKMYVTNDSTLYEWDGSAFNVSDRLPSIANARIFKYNGVIYTTKNYVIYSYDESENVWVQVCKLPFSAANVIEYNNEIHAFGASSFPTSKKHYKWSGPSWEETVKLYGQYAPALMYEKDGLLHIIDNNYYGKYMTFDGTSISEKGPFDTEVHGWTPILYKNEVLFTNSETTIHKLDLENRTVSVLCEAPYKCANSLAIEFEDCLHIIFNPKVYTLEHYTWDGNSFVKICNMPFFGYKYLGFVYKGNMYILLYDTLTLYRFTGTEWVEDSKFPSWPSALTYQRYGSCTIINDKVHIMFIDKNKSLSVHYEWDGDVWTNVCSCNVEYTSYQMAAYKNRLVTFDPGNKKIYTLTNPKATLTFIAKNLLKDDRVYGCTSGNNQNGWHVSTLRPWLNEEFILYLPNALQSVIAISKKYSSYKNLSSGESIEITHDAVWIPSCSEVGSYSYNTDKLAYAQGDVYPIFTDLNSRIRAKHGNSYGSVYKLRSSRTWLNVWGIGSDGGMTGYVVNEAHGVLIGFCI